MIRACKFLLRPTAGRTVALREMPADHCSLHNGALQERRDAARKVAGPYAEVRRKRAGFHHKTARALIRGHDVIAHERLDTAGMTKAPAPRPDPRRDGAFLPNGATSKAGLNRGIPDAGRGQFLVILANKAESAGRRVIAVDPRHTSRTRPPRLGGRGHVAKDNRVTRATFRCTACGLTANADHVGAPNIPDRAGLVLCDVA